MDPAQLLPNSWQCAHCSAPSEVFTSLPSLQEHAEPELRPSAGQTASIKISHHFCPWILDTASCLRASSSSLMIVYGIFPFSFPAVGTPLKWDIQDLFRVSAFPPLTPVQLTEVSHYPLNGHHGQPTPSRTLSSTILSCGMWVAPPGKTSRLFLEATSRFHSHIINTSHLILSWVCSHINWIFHLSLRNCWLRNRITFYCTFLRNLYLPHFRLPQAHYCRIIGSQIF